MSLTSDQIFQYPLINPNIVFVDGISRVGKAALNQILMGLDNVSQPQFIELLEQVLPLATERLISSSIASAIIRLHLNQRIYNRAISRDINFRKADLTSIYNSNNPEQLISQLSTPDGDTVIKSMDKDVILQFQTHDMMMHLESLLETNIPLKMFELVRNPIDTICSWHEKGWGHRLDHADPRSFTLLFEADRKVYPHYAIGLPETYSNYSQLEKCVLLHTNIIRKSIEQYEKTKSKLENKILFLRFEEMIECPNRVIEKSSKFLLAEENQFKDKHFAIANVPRKIDHTEYKNKKQFLLKNTDKKVFEQVQTLEEMYYDNQYFGE